MKNLTLEKVGEEFFQLEEDLKILDWKIGGIQVWPVFRFELFRTVLRDSGVFEFSAAGFPATPLGRSNKIKVLKYLSRLVLSPRALNLVKPFVGKTQVVLVPFYRRDDQGNDHLSNHIIEPFGVRGFRIGSGPADVYLKDQVHRKELNTVFAKLYGPFAKAWIKLNLTKSDLARYAKFVNELQQRLNFSLTSRTEFPVRQFTQFVGQSWGYRDLFKLENVSTVFCVDAIHPSLIRGAKLAKARFAEIQHGSIYPQHPGHNWPFQRGGGASASTRRVPLLGTLLD